MDVDKYFKDRGIQLEKPCEDCGKDISLRHERAIVCGECAYKRQLESQKKWYRKNRAKGKNDS